ncbi:MAG: hypothetical protein K2G64_04680 [Muribaculaceae bacterium]|nr:hypothetical protein [Muribaculaceae bacterium]MDE5968384.1 hypothetical protein [Muribaculaceae bacterium]MDE7393957.1 hypothetical protein [Muribaculaceae bacterium]
MKRLNRSLVIAASLLVTLSSLSSCGPLIAAATVGPDLYVGDYSAPAYPIYNPGYYPAWTPGLIGPGYIPSTPAPAPPGRPGPGNPGGGPNGPGISPSNRPNVAPGTAGTPAQGGFRGQGASSRH